MNQNEYITMRPGNLNRHKRDARIDRALDVAAWMVIAIVWLAAIAAAIKIGAFICGVFGI